MEQWKWNLAAMKGRLKTSGIVIPLVTTALKHPSSSTVSHTYMIQSRSMNCSRACLPTLQLSYTSSDARSIKRFCSLRYCWRSRIFFSSFSIFWCEWSLLWNTLPLAACCFFCCLSCSCDSCFNISCRDCILLLRKSYVKWRHLQPAFMLNCVHSYNRQRSEMGIICGNLFPACRKTLPTREMRILLPVFHIYTCQKNVTLYLFIAEWYTGYKTGENQTLWMVPLLETW